MKRFKLYIDKKTNYVEKDNISRVRYLSELDRHPLFLLVHKKEDGSYYLYDSDLNLTILLSSLTEIYDTKLGEYYFNKHLIDYVIDRIKTNPNRPIYVDILSGVLDLVKIDKKLTKKILKRKKDLTFRVEEKEIPILINLLSESADMVEYL